MSTPEAKLTTRLVTDFGHLIIQVGNMDEALRLYRDTLGLELIPERSSQPIWKVLETRGGELTLYQAQKVTPLILRDQEETPLELHVANFQEAADELERRGYKVKRGKHGGTLVDPWSNLIGLHDHLEG